MKMGHGPGGIIGTTEQPQTMATWIYSMDATMTLTGDLQKMSGNDDVVQMTHKEESLSRIKRDGYDRESLRKTLLSSISPMAPDTHGTEALLNIHSGQEAQPNVNVDRAFDIGTAQLVHFEKSWPEGFYNSLSKEVVTFASKKKRLVVGEHVVLDQEAIYARVIGLLVSQRDFDFQNVLVTEQAAYPPSMFHADGQIRSAAGKPTLKKSLKVEPLPSVTICPTAIVVDVSAVIWTLQWSVHGTVANFISGFKAWLAFKLSKADMYLCFDRYQEYSIKGSTRSARENSSRVHHLTLTTPLPARDNVLKNYKNKARLNSLICEQLLSDQAFLDSTTQTNRLVVTGDDKVPTQVYKGQTTSRGDITSTHEEADIFITQQAIHLAKNPRAQVVVVSDDTDVFALLLHFYLSENLESPMFMESPVKGRATIDIKETVLKHTSLVPSILSVHALSGCDSVAATYGIGKATAVKIAREGNKLVQLGDLSANITDVINEATCFMAACYGYAEPSSPDNASSSTALCSMTECRKHIWAKKTGKSTSAPKLFSLPPTNEAFEQNVYRAHFQVAQWNSTLSGTPPPIRASDYGWEADEINRSLIPRNIREGVPYAPDYILKLIRCGCSSKETCKGNCGCSKNQLACTIFCACGGDGSCFNRLNTPSKDDVITQDDDDIIDDDEAPSPHMNV